MYISQNAGVVRLSEVPLRFLRRVATVWGKIERHVKLFFDYITLPNFANCPRRCNIVRPRTITGSRDITLGENVSIGANSVLETLRHQKGLYPPTQDGPQIIIGDNVSATGDLQIWAACQVIIGDNVLLARNVFIADVTHCYKDVTVPYRDQGLWQSAPVKIGRGSWIGQNTVIQPGVTIGEFAIIGANSVVTKNIPDRTIAVGSPARVVKQWDETTQDWVSTRLPASDKT